MSSSGSQLSGCCATNHGPPLRLHADQGSRLPPRGSLEASLRVSASPSSSPVAESSASLGLSLGFTFSPQDSVEKLSSPHPHSHAGGCSAPRKSRFDQTPLLPGLDAIITCTCKHMFKGMSACEIKVTFSPLLSQSFIREMDQPPF